MKQVRMNAYGTPTVLTMIETAVPKPQAGKILLKVEAVGEIVGLGEGVNAQPFQIGSRVLAILPNGGGYSEYSAAQAQFCVPLLPNIDAEAASTIFVQGSTAHLMLHHVAKDVKGKSILIHAAAGGVGSLLVQSAQLADTATIIAMGSSTEKLNVALALGANTAVN